MKKIHYKGRGGEKIVNTQRNGRSWAVIILAILLFFQAIGLFVIAVNHPSLEYLYSLTLVDPVVSLPLFLRGWAFFALSLLALIAAIGFIRIWNLAWFCAISLQGLCLLIAVVIYFQDRPGYVFLVMPYAIMMTIYLNYSDISLTFRADQIIKEFGGIDES